MSSDTTFSTTADAAAATTFEGLQEELRLAGNDLSDALDRRDYQAYDTLLGRLTRVRGALVMLQQPATAWLASEVQALFEAASSGELVEHASSDEVERARVLVESIDALDTAIAGMDASGSNDSALPWLDRINDMRSLRGKSFVSDALVLALDIDVSDSESDESSLATRQAWQHRCEQHRPGVMRLLLAWFRANNARDDEARDRALEGLVEQLDALAGEDGDTPMHDALILRAGRLVASAVATRRLTDSGSLRRLFGLMERRLATAVSHNDSELLRNLLYYVALAGRDPEHRDDVLESRFDLAGVRDAVRESPGWLGAAPGVSRRLRDSIHARALAQLQPVETWLESGAHWADKRSAKERLVRLQELDAMLTLFGERASRDSLTRIRHQLASLSEGQGVDQDTRLALATHLLELRRRLMEEHAQATRLRPDASRGRDADVHNDKTLADESRELAQRIARTGNQGSVHRDLQHDLEQAQFSLIAESRRRLRETESSLDALLGGESHSSIPQERLVLRIRQIATALSILPLPEASVLLDGLADAIELGAPSNDPVLRQSIARLVVEVDACLDGATRAQSVEDDALGRAESALSAVRRALPGARLFDGVMADAAGPALASATAAPPPGLVREDRDQRALTEAALSSLDSFGEAMAEQPIDVTRLIEPLRTLERIGRRAGYADLSRVCGAALDRLDAEASVLPVEPLTELHAVLPQLIAGIGDNPLDGAVGHLDELVHALAPSPSSLAGADPDATLPGADRSPTTQTTLQHVFITECEGHLSTLEEELAVLPVVVGKRMLRALHTLGGSAQTVGVEAIVEIVSPLQVLAAEHESQSLSAAQAQQLSDAVAQVRTCLYRSVAQESLAIADAPAGAKQRSPALEDVFADEARELIGKLRTDSTDVPVDEDSRSRALSVLHTLKGSARVAGWPQLAERAHEHEARIQSISFEKLASAIEAARRELDAASPQAIELAAAPAQIIATGDTRVTEDSWDRLIGLSSDLTASQARLSMEIDRMDRAARELEAASRRWRRLPSAANLLESEAARELLADVDAVRDSLDAALRSVDTERRLAARASRALQQDLVRARLVRFGDTLPRLQEVVADAATDLGVQAELHIHGEDITLDGALCRRLLPAVEQLLRNAVAHGIESPDERVKAGKPTAGRVQVDVSIDGLELVVGVHDDGRGVSDEIDTLSVLEQSGFTTAKQDDAVAGQLAGHGLGLASIRQLMREIDGTFQMLAVEQGACFELRVPQRVPVQQIVLVQAGACYGIPVNHVREVLAYDDSIESLSALLGHDEAIGNKDAEQQEFETTARRSLILSSHGREMRVSVDAVVGFREVVVQSVGAQLAALGRFSGAAALADGTCALMLNPTAWLEAIPPVKRVSTPSEKTRPRILVVDDSPTQRAWLQDQLEQQGLDVTLACDGQEALELLERTSIDLMLLDIDMPRVDGYGVLDGLRRRSGEASPVLPVLMLTSRSSHRDREAALELGAADMLAKPLSPEGLRDALDAWLPVDH